MQHKDGWGKFGSILLAELVLEPQCQSLVVQQEFLVVSNVGVSHSQHHCKCGEVAVELGLCFQPIFWDVTLAALHLFDIFQCHS